MPAGIAVGTGISWVCMLLMAALLAWLVSTQRIGENGIGYGIMVILPFSTFVGCLAAYGRIRHARLTVSAMLCAVVYISLIVFGFLFGGKMEGFLLHGALVMAGGGISMIPALIAPGSGGRRRNKYRHG